MELVTAPRAAGAIGNAKRQLKKCRRNGRSMWRPFFSKPSGERGLWQRLATIRGTRQVGLEPTTSRLTADCSTIELLPNGKPSLLLGDGAFTLSGGASVSRVTRRKGGVRRPALHLASQRFDVRARSATMLAALQQGNPLPSSRRPPDAQPASHSPGSPHLPGDLWRAASTICCLGLLFGGGGGAISGLCLGSRGGVCPDHRQRDSPAPGRFQRQARRVRHRRGRAVGGAALDAHVSAARAQGQPGQALLHR